MKQLKVLTALAIGIIASSSGIIQTNAALYTFSVNFTTKEVADFNDFIPSYSTNTYGLSTQIRTIYSGSYFFNSCPSPLTLDVSYFQQGRVNGTGTTYSFPSVSLPNFVCTTTPTLYSATSIGTLDPNLVLALVSDDANFVRFQSTLNMAQNGATSGYVLNLSNFKVSFILEYDFNTTYLFNYFLSDTKYNSTSFFSGGGATWTRGSDEIISVDYLYTTAGNDEYRIVNTDFLGSLGTTRKKYAVDYNQEFFRGNSIGASITARYDTLSPFSVDYVTLGSSGSSAVINRYDYYFLNSANQAQAIVTAPIISFTEEVCSGGFLDINVGCYVNNAIAWLVNDAPVISDAFTLLNTGIELAAQTFGIIGSFSDDNVFGYLILVGFGFIAVKWFLKNDE
jgi:hypothetical protein